MMSLGISLIGIILLLGLLLLFAGSVTTEQAETATQEGEAPETEGNPIAFWISMVALWIVGSGVIMQILAAMLAPHH